MIIRHKWNLSMIVCYSYSDLNYYDFLTLDDQIISISHVYVRTSFLRQCLNNRNFQNLFLE